MRVRSNLGFSLGFRCVSAGVRFSGDTEAHVLRQSGVGIITGSYIRCGRIHGISVLVAVTLLFFTAFIVSSARRSWGVDVSVVALFMVLLYYLLSYYCVYSIGSILY